jgi:two-component system, chemotaxis family, chemotaxis protein CheY
VPQALIVDDSRAMRMILAKAMKELGFATSAAGNGKEALTVLESGGSPPEVMLVDWNMPEMDGVTLVRALRADLRFANVPIVMVTSESGMDQIMEALEAGANEYIMKPFTPDAIGDKLRLLGALA